MAISLFPHNQTAYDAAVSMMAETGKAAVIHPTGTGKSVIAFKLAEEHPEATVCWLSPSEYIFQTQIENLKSESDVRFDNIQFFTYARLMRMSEAAMEEIKPDYIILDEFHRCGAGMWSRGVQSLLHCHPTAKLLGLSATNIRYLDNQRDMADELFDGNVVSQMTLGEAIVRGILNPPVYVTCLYAYQKELERLEHRTRQTKNRAARDAAEKYLEALRRALEEAGGLDEVFRKHMENRSGKYLVFCANREHMDQMVEKVPEWFSKVDAAPHIYEAYADDPRTEKTFRAFKRDDSGHLKLLFCIDMLNEGVHVEDVDGVVLFRPTISPIIYKQQVGRALSAKKNRNPIIFDIVNNFENLYSIGAIEDEMDAAVLYYRDLGRNSEIRVEHFRVIDEVRECRRLFDQLEETLTASWEAMYGCAKRYYKQFGNLNVPKHYKTPEGYSLGNWVMTQRKVRNGKAFGKLDAERIRKLDDIGMVWDSAADISWEQNLAAAKAYRERFGDLNVPARYVTENGVRLGAWIARQRIYRKSGIRRSSLTMERIRQLDELGMIWQTPDYLWNRNYSEALQYYRSHGDLNVPAKYVTENGMRLGEWLLQLRRNYEGKGKGAPPTEEQGPFRAQTEISGPPDSWLPTDPNTCHAS